LPIALEIGEGLIPEDTSSEWTLLKFYVPQMRQRLQDEMGIEVSGVRVRRSSTYLPSGRYNVLLFENPVLTEKEVPLDRRYCPVSPEKLHKLGISISDLIQAPHPLTGQPGSWVPPDKYELVTSQNLELWAEPLVYIIYHLEAIVRRNLANFWNLEDVEEWLHKEEADESYQRLIALALPDQQTRFFLARVLRALLREQVSISRRKDILTVFWESRLIEGNLSEAVRAVRLRLKHWLPGNQRTAQRLELSKDWEDGLGAGLEYVDGQTYFTAPPRETAKFLSMIHRTVPTTGENLVMVIQNAELRPFLRLLVEAELPSLAVLSEEEVFTSDEALTAHDEHATRTEGVNTDAE
jgi:flagellar biosynthesis component FlhA